MKHFLSAFLVFFWAVSAYAFSGHEGAAFLDIPVGARPAALGDSYTALAEDAYAPAYNPAGLGLLKGGQFSGQHISYLENTHYEFLSLGIPFSSGRGFGVSVRYLGSPDIPRTDENGVQIAEFSNSYQLASLSYGQQWTKQILWGVTGKIIQGHLDDQSASAYAADFGAMIHTSPHILVGAALVNVGSGLKFSEQNDPLPTAVRIGVAARQKTVTATLEGIARADSPASLHGGVEWRAVDILALRLGYRTDTLRESTALAGLTAGMGFYLWKGEISYAYMPLDDLGTAHYFSFLLHF
jgi:hypothetical protein